MSKATRILRNRIVLIFDFDETLGPSTTETFFDHYNLDYQPFTDAVNRHQEEEMWQYPLAKAQMLREWSHRADSPVRKENMKKLGQAYPLYPGADTLVQRLKKYSAEKDEKIELIFVLLTAGFSEIPGASAIGQQFDLVYAGELLFDDEGRILGAKRVISHVDKVHYIKQLNQGIDLDKPSDLENTYVKHDEEKKYVPMSQVIYVGDGASDMSAFQAVESEGGIAIAIVPEGDDEDWSGYEQMAPARRVHNVAKANYEDGSELYRSLQLAVDRMTAEIQLLRMGKGE